MLQIDSRTFAEAYRIASKILGVAMACIVPILIGFFLDQRLNAKPVFMIAGTVVGLLAMVMQLKQLVRELQSSKNRTR